MNLKDRSCKNIVEKLLNIIEQSEKLKAYYHYIGVLEGILIAKCKLKYAQDIDLLYIEYTRRKYYIFGEVKMYKRKERYDEYIIRKAYDYINS